MRDNSNRTVNLFIIFNGSGVGGGERIVAEISNHLPTRISQKIVTMYNSPLGYRMGADRISLVHYYKHLILRLVSRPIILFRLVALLISEKPDVCLSVSPTMCIYSMLASIITKSKVIISVHTMPSYYTPITKLIKFFEFTLARILKTHIVAVSQGVKEELIRLHHISEENITVIYNPYHLTEISQLSPEKITEIDGEDSRPTIITAGRLYWVKGQWHLIRAFATLLKTHDCRLIICGDGKERPYLTSLVNDLGISENVIFLGWQQNPYKYMAKSRLSVLPSLSESFGNVIVESMACGCPVVVANCSPAIGEVMGSDNSCGFITKKMSGIRHEATAPLDEGEKDLLESMKKILDNSKLREEMSVACRERAKLFDLDIGIQNYVNLIERIAKRG